MTQDQITPEMRRSCVRAAGLGLIAALSIPLGAAAQTSEPVTASSSDMAGRWLGRAHHIGAPIASPAGELRLTIDLAACGERICGRLVIDEVCRQQVLELTAIADAKPGQASHKGRLTLPGEPPLDVRAFHLQATGQGKPRLIMRTDDAPLYTRRLPSGFTASLERGGPAACELQRTS